MNIIIDWLSTIAAYGILLFAGYVVCHFLNIIIRTSQILELKYKRMKNDRF